MNNSDIFAMLKKNPALKDVPEEQIQWLGQNSECKFIPEGDIIFESGVALNHMIIILSGEIKLYFKRNNGTQELTGIQPNDITGLLPFSRMKETRATGEVIKDAWVLFTHRDVLKKMISLHYELTQTLVHEMTSRVRSFTSLQQQNEKMMALGKVAAGLAHELNNPAAAVVRSSDSLKKHVATTPEKFKKLMLLELTEAQVDGVNKIIFEKIAQPIKALSLKQRTMLESELEDWLDDNEIDADDLADNLIEFGFGLDELEEIETILEGEQLEPVLGWVNNVLTTERTVRDIHEASCRISDLVNSVKSYTHMDRSHDKLPTDVHQGLDDTLNILKHKIKVAEIEIERKFEEGLPQPKLKASEINQVFTNLIDNSIDALEGRENPKITIRTKKNRDFVLIDIEDNGPGIPEEIKSQIFDPFFTTKDVGKGSGMGLDITHRIIKQHNGQITLDSEPGRTTFQICIPISG